tara:strand:+ start:418 stop:591 length:174 start_codon:yes stop_codon:yes gene_type:complete
LPPSKFELGAIFAAMGHNLEDRVMAYLWELQQTTAKAYSAAEPAGLIMIRQRDQNFL